MRAAILVATLAAAPASLAALAGCGSPKPATTLPAEKPIGPPVDGKSGGGTAGAPAAGAPRRVLVGEMCPERAAGGPAVSVLAVREVGWRADAEELDHTVARMGQRAFAVLGWRGGRAGTFTALGTIAGNGPPMVTGGYAGRGVCEAEDGGEIPGCATATERCGLAVAALDAADPEESPVLRTGGGCVEAGRLHVDIDGDGRVESFRQASFLDEQRGPAEEVGADEKAPSASCSPGFAITELVPGRDPKGFLGMDLLGVVDLDDDGRMELLLQFRYRGTRTWAIYAASQSASRLELALEIVPWAATS